MAETTVPCKDDATASVRVKTGFPSVTRGPEEPFDGYEPSFTGGGDGTTAESLAPPRRASPSKASISVHAESTSSAKYATPAESAAPTECKDRLTSFSPTDGTMTIHATPSLSRRTGATQAAVEPAPPLMVEAVRRHAAAIHRANHQLASDLETLQGSPPHDSSVQPSFSLVDQLAYFDASGSIQSVRDGLSLVQSVLDDNWQKQSGNKHGRYKIGSLATHEAADMPASDARPTRTAAKSRPLHPSNAASTRSATIRDPTWMDTAERLTKISLTGLTAISIGYGLLHGASYKTRNR